MTHNPEIDRWFGERNHPMTEAMRRLRDVILEADPRIEEVVKWKTPTWVFKGNIASLNPQAKKFVSVLFHNGAQIPGEHSLLQGGGDVARYMQFVDAAEIEAKRDQVQAVVRAWCDWKSG